MSAMRREHLFWLLILAQVGFWVVFLRHLPFFRLPLHFLDFDSYLRLWQDVFTGTNPYTVSHMTTLGPPLVLLPFLPFSFLPASLSQFVFFIINVYCGYALTQQLVQVYLKGDKNLWLGASLILFASFPTRFSLLMGQPALIIAYLLTLFLTSKSKVVPLFLLIVFKTFFLGLFLGFIRRPGILIQVSFMLAAAAFAFSPLLLPRWYTYYLERSFSPTLMSKPLGGSSDYYNQSLKSSLHRVDMDDVYLPLTAVAIVVLGSLIIRRGSLPLAAVTSVYLSPVVWQHYMVFLYPVMAILFFTSKNLKVKGILILSFLLTAVAFPGLHGAELTGFTRLLASHMFIGMSLLLLAALLLSRETLLRQTQLRENLS